MQMMAVRCFKEELITITNPIMKGHVGESVGGMMNYIIEMSPTVYHVYILCIPPETIACLLINPKETHLLSNPMDETMHTWDIRSSVDDDAE